jgi:pimeloyl-ACP methyl ester carboxylesterase
MGAVTMIRAAAHHPEIEALVADSPFVTLEDELDLRVPYPLLNPLIRILPNGRPASGSTWFIRSMTSA